LIDRPGRAVILLSGGLDSATTLAVARDEGCELYALSFDYRQRHNIELESAKKVALSFGVKRHLIVKIDLREIGGSALTSDLEVPKAGTEVQKRGSAQGQRHGEASELPDFRTSCPGGSPKETDLIPVTYVPARNTIFLSFALGWAEVLQAGDIFIGANAIDYSGYPDCRPEYLRAFEDMANLATKISVEGKLRFRIRAPLITMKKSDIIRRGTALGVDYSLTWSCYDPQTVRESGSAEGDKDQEPKTSPLANSHTYVPCGLCDSCRLRAKGFAEAGLPDPILQPPHFNEG
jgi:7-cyano-7-deazaguanine synthase